ncbi:MAG: DUF4114 domain-containing protein, partial [Prochloraceae cyanobacterium]
FFMVQNSTVDKVLDDLAAGKTPANVFFATTAANGDGVEHLNVSSISSGKFSLQWEDLFGTGDADFNDLGLTAEVTTEQAPLGNPLQGGQTQEVLDLRSVNGSVQIQFSAFGNSGYNNIAGFYTLANESGTVIDPITKRSINPGESGYTEAALAQSVVQFNENARDSTVILKGGSIYAPYILSNGQKQNAFFSFLEANADGIDHVRLLGDNTFGFEDMFGSSDQDFDDLVLTAKIIRESTTVDHSWQIGESLDVLDFSAFNNQQVQAQFSVSDNSGFDNLIGFYKLANDSGAVRDSLTGNLINPNELGYTEAALAQNNIVVQFSDNQTELTAIFEGGSLYAPYIISNGENIFFSFLEANSDGIDHVRLLPNNTFGFEDLLGGGDFDYNDVKVQVNVNPL